MKVSINVAVATEAAKEKVWDFIGSFENIGKWFPGIDNTTTETNDAGTIRHLTLADGAMISDQLIDIQENQYTYKIIKGELPFKNYVATVGVKRKDGLTIIYYQASIDVSSENKDMSIELLENLYKGAYANVKIVLE